MPRFAAIDVGSNAIRLLVAEAESAGAVKVLTSVRAPVRLGRDVFTNGKLAPAAISAAIEALKKFREAIDEHKVDRVHAVATSAVREAENGALLVERARRDAGVELDVVEGVEEARLVRVALIGRLALHDRRALLVDLGGGSTELSLVERGQLRASRSLPVGTVRLLEAFPASKEDGATLAREYVDRQLREAIAEFPKGSFDVAIGTGGNFESLAQLASGNASSPPPSSGNGSEKPAGSVDVVALRALLPKIAALSPDERRTLWNLRPDRADVIHPAAEIVACIAHAFGVERILVPGIGLKEGILDELVEKHFDVWDYGGEAQATIDAALRLGRRFHFDEAHGQLVARLSIELFDQLRPMHRLGDRDRLLLHGAALLHDVGDYIRYEGHHRHTHYILSNSDVVGLSPKERTLVANVARYHRKSLPDASHPNFRDLDRDDRGRVRALAAILRIGDALDREHQGKVTAARAILEKGRMRLHLTGAKDRQLEEWTVARKSELFREVFDREVEIAR